MSSLSIESQPDLAEAFESFCLKGCYVLVGFIVKIDSKGNPFWLITIADATDTLTLYTDNRKIIYSNLQPNGLAKVKARLLMSSGLFYFQCETIQPVDGDRNRFESLRQLPRSLCPKAKDFDKMIQLVDSILEDCLARFVLDVLSQPEIGIAYIKNPGSISHHHNYGGGLLEHSVQVAQYFHDDKEISDENRSLGIVASLFHDIGKTLCYTSNINYTALGYLVSHDSLTLEICSTALDKLSTENAGYANQLRHAWTCATLNSRYGYKPKTVLARKLQQYDRTSANFCKKAASPAFEALVHKETSIEKASVY